MAWPAASLHPTRTGEAFVAVTKGVAFDNGPCRALYVGVGGTLNFTPVNGVACSLVPTVSGGYILTAVESVEAGGTATDIYAIY